MDEWNVESIHGLIHDIETTEGATMSRSALLNLFDYIRELEEENERLANSEKDLFEICQRLRQENGKES